jgi:hypothetical protein
MYIISRRRGGDLRYDLCRWHFFIKRLVPEVDADPKRPVVIDPGCADVVSLTSILVLLRINMDGF